MIDFQFPALNEEEYPDSTGPAKEKAELAGMDVIVADDRMLQLDLDTSNDAWMWERVRHRLADIGLKVESVEEWPSKSGNKHVVIRLETAVPLAIRICYQAILGSDRKREWLCMRDMVLGHEFPVMLFRPKQKQIEAAPVNALIGEGAAA